MQLSGHIMTSGGDENQLINFMRPNVKSLAGDTTHVSIARDPVISANELNHDVRNIVHTTTPFLQWCCSATSE